MALGKLLNVQPGEGFKVLHFALLAALLEAGVAVGLTTTDTLFLLNLGVEKLSIVYLLTPVFMLLYLPVYSYLLARIGLQKLFYVIIFTLCLGGILFYGGYTLHSRLAVPGLDTVLYYGGRFYTAVWVIGLYTVLWNFIDTYFDALNAKRLFPLFSAGAAAGGVCGGMLVSLLSTRMPVENLFLVWSILALLIYPVLLRIGLTYRPIELDDAPDQEAGTTRLGAQLVALLRSFRLSRFSIILSLSLFIGVFIATLLHYQYSGVFAADRTEAELASLFGRLYASVNLLNIFISLFVFNRLVNAIGVRNTALILPLFHVAVFTYFLLQFGFGAAVAGFLVMNGIMVSIDTVNANLLFNGLPKQGKSHIRAFIEGIGEPVAVACAGLFLLLAGQALTPDHISATALALSLVSVIVVLLLRRDYVLAFLANLKSGWVNFFSPWEPAFRQLGEEEIVALQKRSLSPDGMEALRAIEILHPNRPGEATDALLQFLQRRLTEDEKGESRRLLGKFLRSGENEVFHTLVRWLNHEQIHISPVLLQELASYRLIPRRRLQAFVRSPDPDEQSAAAIGLWQSPELGHNGQALQLIDHLLQTPGEPRLAGIRSLGRLKQSRHAEKLLPYLNENDPGIRRETLQTLWEIVTPENHRLLPEMLQILRRGNKEERRLALGIIEKFADVHAITPLLSSCRKLTAADRRQIERMITRMGYQAVPLLVHTFQNGRYSTFARSIAARALSQLSFSQLEALAHPIIINATKRLYQFIDYTLFMEAKADENDGLRVMQGNYRDLPQLIISFNLEILSLMGKLPNYELVISSLRAPSAKTRANAIETIAQACPRKILRHLLPLLDGRPAVAQQAYGVRNRFVSPYTLDTLLNQASMSSFPLELSAALHVRATQNEEGLHDLMMERFRELPDPLVELTIADLLQKRRGEGVSARLNPVERAALLRETDFFKIFSMHEIELLLTSGEEKEYRRGEAIWRKGEIPDFFAVLISGEAVWPSAGHEPVTFRRGQLPGGDCTLGQLPSPADLISDSCRILKLPRQSVIHCAEVYPNLFLSLLRDHSLLI